MTLQVYFDVSPKAIEMEFFARIHELLGFTEDSVSATVFFVVSSDYSHWVDPKNGLFHFTIILDLILKIRSAEVAF